MAFATPEHPEVRPEIRDAQQRAWDAIARPGSHWTGAERVAIARRAREARQRRADPPWLRRDLPEAGGELSEAAVRAARTIAVDARTIDAPRAKEMIAALGDAAYVELAAIVVSVCAIDTYAEALGVALEPLPAPRPGEPDGARAPGTVAGIAHVPMIDPFPGPNVARALSLVPAAAQMFFDLVMAMYAGPGGFYELVWDGPLARPQAELLAARVSAVNECFY